MKTNFTWFLGAALGLISHSALAWDGPESWAAPADGQPPGGGRIHGTGGQRDHAIECKHCHIDSDGLIDAKYTPTPAFDAVSDKVYYQPGTKYTFSVELVGEHLGLSGCGQYVAHTNNFAATFEDSAGNPTGVLESDSGQNQATNCPVDIFKPDTGTTILYDDCRVVVPHANVPQGSTNWTFYWTAPAAGTGDVTLFAGMVDGDCVMDSRNDDVKMVKLTLADGSTLARIEPKKLPRTPARNDPGFPWSPLGVSALAIGLLRVTRRRS